MPDTVSTLKLIQISPQQHPTAYLQLVFSPQPNPATDAAQLVAWLQQFPAIDRVQVELSMDLVLIRFTWDQQPFYLHLEHYTEACWIDTDSTAADMLMSELAQLLSQNIS